MKLSFRQALVLAAGITCLAGGCATTTISSTEAALPQKRPKLFRTQAGSQVTLQWESSPGAHYSVIFTSDMQDPSQWRILPGYEDIPGKGGTQSIIFQAPQPGRLYYRLSPTSSGSQ